MSDDRAARSLGPILLEIADSGIPWDGLEADARLAVRLWLASATELDLVFLLLEGRRRWRRRARRASSTTLHALRSGDGFGDDWKDTGETYGQTLTTSQKDDA